MLEAVVEIAGPDDDCVRLHVAEARRANDEEPVRRRGVQRLLVRAVIADRVRAGGASGGAVAEVEIEASREEGGDEILAVVELERGEPGVGRRLGGARPERAAAVGREVDHAEALLRVEPGRGEGLVVRVLDQEPLGVGVGEELLSLVRRGGALRVVDVGRRPRERPEALIAQRGHHRGRVHEAHRIEGEVVVGSLPGVVDPERGRRDVARAELLRVSERDAVVRPLVAPVHRREGFARQRSGEADALIVLCNNCERVAVHEEIRVDRAALDRRRERVALGLADVERASLTALHEEAPAARRDEERDRDVALVRTALAAAVERHVHRDDLASRVDVIEALAGAGEELVAERCSQRDERAGAAHAHVQDPGLGCLEPDAGRRHRGERGQVRFLRVVPRVDGIGIGPPREQHATRWRSEQRSTVAGDDVRTVVVERRDLRVAEVDDAQGLLGRSDRFVTARERESHHSGEEERAAHQKRIPTEPCTSRCPRP